MIFLNEQDVYSLKKPLDVCMKFAKKVQEENLETGIWYVDATREGDHGAVIGLNSTKTSTVKFYKELFEMINNL